jgi:hypothetical protein
MLSLFDAQDVSGSVVADAKLEGSSLPGLGQICEELLTEEGYVQLLPRKEMIICLLLIYKECCRIHKGCLTLFYTATETVCFLDLAGSQVSHLAERDWRSV